MNDALKSSIEEAIRHECSTHGVEPSFVGGRHAEGSIAFGVIVGGRPGQDTARRVYISRTASFDEGDTSPTRTFMARDDQLSRRDRRHIATMVTDAVRMRARDAVVAQHQRSGMAPAWAYSMHPVARMLIMHAGGGLVPTFVPVPDNQVKMARKNRRAAVGSLTTGRALRVTPGNFLGGYGRGIVEARGERIFAHDLEIGVRPDKGPEATFIDTSAPEIHVYGASIPDTLVAGCPGLDLSHVIGHPAFGTSSGIRVVGASNEDGYLRVRLPALLEPIAAAPAGVDVSWRVA